MQSSWQRYFGLSAVIQGWGEGKERQGNGEGKFEKGRGMGRGHRLLGCATRHGLGGPPALQAADRRTGATACDPPHNPHHPFIKYKSLQD